MKAMKKKAVTKVAKDRMAKAMKATNATAAMKVMKVMEKTVRNIAKVELDVKLISGDHLAKLTAVESWTGADVKKALQKHLAPGTRINKLLRGAEEMTDEQMLADAHLAGSAQLVAIVR